MLSDTQIQKKIKILTNKLNVGNFKDVIDETSILLKKNKHQVFFNILCLAYQSTNDLKNSEKVMEEALKLNPNNPYFLNNMGVTQHKIGNLKIAENFFIRGLKIAPDYINILNNLGNLKSDLDQTDEALNYYKKSLSINSKAIETLINISICYQSLGNFTKAKDHLFDLLKINPVMTIADRLISSMLEYEENNSHLADMLKKSKQLKLDNIQSANLFFALGKAYEDLKNYDQSFKYYNQGNIILKKMSNFKIENEKKIFSNIKEIFSSKFNSLNDKESRKIIFIVGMPRSGTSLIEQILSSHKNVYGGGELIYLKKIINNKFLTSANIDISNIIQNIENLFKDCHDEYINKISHINNSNKVFTDKSPLNFKYIGFIKKIFPNSKIINCKRNSLDVCWSNYKNYFGDSLPFTSNLYDIGNYYKMYEDLIKFWKNIFLNEIYDVDYNKLIDNSEIEIKKLLEFCDLEWDPNCIEHEKNDKAIKTASVIQARKPINRTGLNTYEPYKNYLNELSKILSN